MVFSFLAVIKTKNINVVLMKFTEEKVGIKAKQWSRRQFFIAIWTTS